MIKKWKRIIAAVLSSAMIFTSAGCTAGKNTAYALTVDGYKVKAGVYIYYSYTALSEAKSLAKKQDENLDVEDEDALKKVKIEGKNFLDFVKDKATESCISHVATIKHFDELELSLTEEQEDEISEYVEMNWEQGEDMFTNNGISKESIKEVMTSSFKSDEIFKAYYGENGSENVTDSQLQDFYTENNARVRFVDMDLHDVEGNELDENGKKEIDDMANDFLKRAKSAANEEKMLEEFDKFQEEYDKYVSDKTAEAAGDNETDSDDLTDDSSLSESESSSETSTEALTEDAESSEDTENDSSLGEDSTSDSESESEEATEPTGDESSDSEAAVTTAPESEDGNETTTTTTTAPYANEVIIPVVTTEEGTKEEDVTYNPSKECYDWIFNKAKTGVPEIVEDENTMYVIVRLDIKERMTEDDLWNENGVESVRYNMFSDDLQDMLDSWGKEYEVVKNQKAYKRYDPFNIKDENDI